MAIFEITSPELDGSSITLGNGTPKLRVIEFDSIPTPFWVRFDEQAHGFKISSVPFRIVRRCSKVEIFTFDPTGPECL